jgi:hypothetical protein
MEEELVAILGKLIEAVDTLSPHIWEIAVRQVYVEAAQNFVLAAICAVFAYVLARIAKICHKKLPDIDRDLEFPMTCGIIFGWAGSAICVALTIAAVLNNVAYLINPHYYAIQNLLEFVQ